MTIDIGDKRIASVLALIEIAICRHSVADDLDLYT